jgi:hypothetical protein
MAVAMSIGSFLDHLFHPFHPSAQAQGTSGSQGSPKTSDSGSGDLDFSFDDLVDIVNPLQHLPVVGTLYRAITHDTIKTPEKIAGDTLYGGLWGFVSSVADTAFQALTGKNFGDAVLALFTGGDSKSTAVAGTATSGVPAGSQSTTPDITALNAALSRSGANSELAQRAVYAYRRATSLVAAPALAPY